MAVPASSRPAGPLFLVLDGVDGSGKSTQQRLLCDWLTAQGYEVVSCRDPGSTPLAEKIRSILLAAGDVQIGRPAEMFLYMAARAQLVEEVIRPALAAGKIVVSDRFLLSNVVYQGHAGGLDPDEVWRIGRSATDGLEPTLTLLFDMPPEAATDRIRRAPDRMEQQGKEFRERLRAGYLTEAARNPNRIVVIDAARTIDDVQAAIRTTVEKVLTADA
jgi:dTMP kinase